MNKFICVIWLIMITPSTCGDLRMCASVEPTHWNVRGSWVDTDPSSLMCRLGDPLFSETIDCESGKGTLSHASDPTINRRNYTSGEIVYAWRWGLQFLHFEVDATVVRAVMLGCRVIQNFIIDLKHRKYDAAQNVHAKTTHIDSAFNKTMQIAAENLKLNVEEWRWVQQTESSAVSIVFDGTRSLAAITAALLFRMTLRISTLLSRTHLTESIIRQVDEEHFQLHHSLYYSQVIAGFFACRSKKISLRSEAQTSSHWNCPAAAAQLGRGKKFYYQGTARDRWGYMAQLLRRTKTKRILEVGVNTGSLAHWILDRDASFHYIGVDPWFNDDDKYADVQKRLVNHVKSGRAHIIRGVLQDVNPDSFDPVDIVWIDGDHSYEAVLQDISLAPRFLHHAGTIAGHDFFPWHLDIMEAVLAKATSLGVDIHLGMDFVWWLGQTRSSSSMSVELQEVVRAPFDQAATDNLQTIINYEARVESLAEIYLKTKDKSVRDHTDIVFGSLFNDLAIEAFVELLNRTSIPPWLQTLTDDRIAKLKVWSTSANNIFWDSVIAASGRRGPDDTDPWRVPPSCCARFQIRRTKLKVECPKDHGICVAMVKAYVIALEIALKSNPGRRLFRQDREFFMSWDDCFEENSFGVALRPLLRDVPIFTLSAPRESTAIVMPNNGEMLLNTHAIRVLNEVKFDVPYSAKVNQLLWRGQLSSTLAERQKASLALGGVVFDVCNITHVKRLNRFRLARLSHRFPEYLNARLVMGRMSRCKTGISEFMKEAGLIDEPIDANIFHYQFNHIMSVEGYGGDDRRVAQVQRSNSVLFRLPPYCIDWLQEVEIPGEHYIEVRDMRDLIMKLKWVQERPDVGRYVAEKGRQFSREARSYPATLYAFVVLVQKLAAPL